MLHFLLPAPCLICQEPLAHAGCRADGMGLCASCRSRLRESPAAACPSCGAPGAAAGLSCAACREAPRSYRRLLWGWYYSPPMNEVIAALKFRRLDYLGRQLGAQLGRRFGAALAPIDVVTAVPLGFWRRLGRGFDQAEAIAAALAPACGDGRPCRRLLARRRATPPQSLASFAERRQNLAAAFRPTSAAKAWRGCHILLIDDVITTGATLEAAAAALLEAGAGQVTALAAARTASPEELA